MLVNNKTHQHKTIKIIIVITTQTKHWQALIIHKLIVNSVIIVLHQNSSIQFKKVVALAVFILLAHNHQQHSSCYRQLKIDHRLLRKLVTNVQSRVRHIFSRSSERILESHAPDRFTIRFATSSFRGAHRGFSDINTNFRGNF